MRPACSGRVGGTVRLSTVGVRLGMPHITAQVIFPFFTNLPTDVITNTFTFDNETPVTLEAAGDALQPIIEDFYQAVYGSTVFSNYLNISAASIRFYRSDSPIPRVPYIKNLWSGSAPATTTSVLPTEVALVCSFQGDREPGTPQARNRGRIYLGGLASGAVTASSASAFPTINATLRSAVVAAAEALRDAAALASLSWSVWSRVDQRVVHVTNGWVDNTPDTQRRRSVDPTARTTWS